MVAKNAKTAQRRSGRIARQLPIQVSGIDVMGHDFTVPTHTLVLSRYGAEIILKAELVPDQEISITLLGNAQDWDARVVGLFTKGPEGYAYGIEFLFQDANFWGITFPPVSGAADLPADTKAAAPAETSKDAKADADDDDLDQIWKKMRKAAPQKNYAIRLKCPHNDSHGGSPGEQGPESFGEADQWLILQNRPESLQLVLETPWDFVCPIHGAQREFPLEAKEAQPGLRIWLQGSEPKSSTNAKGAKQSQASGPQPRREARRPQTLRVWVRGVDLNGNAFRQSACSLDISRNGARLDGLGLITWPGTTIEVRRHWRKALFRIVWTGKKGTPEATQIGVVCLEPSKNVWGMPEDN